MAADDFMDKRFSKRVLTERVKTVLTRATEKGDPADIVFERGSLRMDKARYVCTWRDLPVSEACPLIRPHARRHPWTARSNRSKQRPDTLTQDRNADRSTGQAPSVAGAPQVLAPLAA
jgi:hypothetical protein